MCMRVCVCACVCVRVHVPTANVIQIQICSAESERAWSVGGCGHWVVSRHGTTAGIQLLCWFSVAGGLPGSGGTDPGWPVCHCEGQLSHCPSLL